MDLILYWMYCAQGAVDTVMGPHTIQHETVVVKAATAPVFTTSGVGSDACSVHTIIPRCKC